MLEVLFLLLIIIAVIAACVYFYIDFTKHKESNVSDFEKVRTDVVSEQETRTSNIASIVQQVNDVNYMMDTENKEAIAKIDETVNDVVSKYTTFETGFGSIIKTTDAITGEQVPLREITSSTPVDVQFFKHVNMLGGMSINELSRNDNKRVRACGSGSDATRCIEFPNDIGDTYITSLTSGGKIIAGAPLKTQGIDVTGNIKIHDTNNLEFMSFFEVNDTSVISGANTIKLTAPNGVEVPRVITLSNGTSTDTATIHLDNQGLKIGLTNGASIQLSDETISINAKDGIMLNGSILNTTSVVTPLTTLSVGSGGSSGSGAPTSTNNNPSSTTPTSVTA